VSDAKVTFQKMDYTPAGPGEEERFSFVCPRSARGVRCSGLIIAGKTGIKRNGQNKNGGSAQWDWDGNRDSPTFRPSIDCGGCWHGFLVRGRCVDTSNKDEPQL
jgi:hypothetical protein